MKKTLLNKEISPKGKEAKSDDMEKLLIEVAKFREANQKFLLPDLNDHELVGKYKIAQSNHTSDINQIYG